MDLKRISSLEKTLRNSKYIVDLFDTSKKYDESCSVLLETNMTHLTFGAKFNQSVDNLPYGITHLTFGNEFNQPIDNLPNSINFLTFKSEYVSNKFNQLIDNLPNSITHLVLGYCFNKTIDFLPNSITHLTLGQKFNQNVDNLPINLKVLTFGMNFNKPINNLPKTLEKISLRYTTNYQHLIENLPNSVKELDLGNYSEIKKIKKLPDCLEKLYYFKEDYFEYFLSSHQILKIKSDIQIFEYSPYEFGLDNNSIFDDTDYVYESDDSENVLDSDDNVQEFDNEDLYNQAYYESDESDDSY